MTETLSTRTIADAVVHPLVGIDGTRWGCLLDSEELANIQAGKQRALLVAAPAAPTRELTLCGPKGSQSRQRIDVRVTGSFLVAPKRYTADGIRCTPETAETSTSTYLVSFETTTMQRRRLERKRELRRLARENASDNSPRATCWRTEATLQRLRSRLVTFMVTEDAADLGILGEALTRDYGLAGVLDLDSASEQRYWASRFTAELERHRVALQKSGSPTRQARRTAVVMLQRCILPLIARATGEIEVTRLLYLGMKAEEGRTNLGVCRTEDMLQAGDQLLLRQLIVAPEDIACGPAFTGRPLSSLVFDRDDQVRWVSAAKSVTLPQLEGLLACDRALIAWMEAARDHLRRHFDLPLEACILPDPVRRTT